MRPLRAINVALVSLALFDLMLWADISPGALSYIEKWRAMLLRGLDDERLRDVTALTDKMVTKWHIKVKAGEADE